MTVLQASAAYSVPAAPLEVMGDGPARAAYEAFHAGSPAAATEMARPLAESGNADAWFLLAFAMEGKEPAKMSRGQAMDYD